jgi:hypothetical protein
MGRLRLQCLALVDADCVLPEDGRALLAALDAALLGMTAGDLPAARAGIERFIAGAQRLIQAGRLAGRDGHPPLEAARALLAALCSPVLRG